MRANPARETELWLKIYKKASGVPTVTYQQALEVALCWGWIDGLKKSFDDEAFLQRFSPRKSKSVWSQINCGHVARLTNAGRMTPHGQRHIDSAKADGRWLRPTRPSAATASIRRPARRHSPARARFARSKRSAARTFRPRVPHEQHENPGRQKIADLVAMPRGDDQPENRAEGER
jgi:hypothetical protein